MVANFERIAANVIGTARASGPVNEHNLVHYLDFPIYMLGLPPIKAVPAEVVERSRAGFYDALAGFIATHAAIPA
jgi:hypothetical protein